MMLTVWIIHELSQPVEKHSAKVDPNDADSMDTKYMNSSSPYFLLYIVVIFIVINLIKVNTHESKI